MKKLINLIRPDLREFVAYSSARDEFKKTASIWLNANESPFPNEIENHILLNRYPEKQPKKLLQELSNLYQVNEQQIVVSRGSDEVIDLLIRLLCCYGKDSIMLCPPTFGMYAVCAQLQGAKIIEVPLIKNNGFQLDVPMILKQCNPNMKLLFLCSPNNPTGNVLKTADILTLCEKLREQTFVVVDEAYIDYSDSESLSKYIKQYPNLVILHTFSKAYGLAAARAGVLIAQEELVQWILKIIPPYPIPASTAQLLLKTLTERKQIIKDQIEIIKSERERMFDKLKKLACVKKVWPSEANFLLLETDDANKVMQHCADNGIILRSMHSKPGLENCVRISIGLPEENERLLKIL